MIYLAEDTETRALRTLGGLLAPEGTDPGRLPPAARARAQPRLPGRGLPAPRRRGRSGRRARCSAPTTCGPPAEDYVVAVLARPSLTQPSRRRGGLSGTAPYDAVHGNDEHEQGHPRRDPTRPRPVRRSADHLPGRRRERAQQLGAAWENFDEQLTDHHEGEHEIAWPALEQVGVTRETHRRRWTPSTTLMADGPGADARSAMAALESEPGQGEAEAALTAMQHLRTSRSTHLDHEEQEIEPVYLEKTTARRSRRWASKFAKVRTLPRAGRSSPGCTDGATPQEQAAVTREHPGAGAGRHQRPCSAGATARRSRRSGRPDRARQATVLRTGRARPGSGRRAPGRSVETTYWCLLGVTHALWRARTPRSSGTASRGRGTPWATGRPAGRRWPTSMVSMAVPNARADWAKNALVFLAAVEGDSMPDSLRDHARPGIRTDTQFCSGRLCVRPLAVARATSRKVPDADVRSRKVCWSHQSELLQNNAVVVQGRSGVLLVDPGITGAEMTCLASDLSRAGPARGGRLRDAS